MGNLEIPKSKHKILADLIEQFVKNNRQQDMFEEDETIIASAKHFAELIIKKRLAQAQTRAEEEDLTEKTPQKETEPWFETVYVHTASTSQCRTIGVEHIALTQLNKLHWGGKFISSGETDEDHAPWEVPYGRRGPVRTMSSQTRVTTSLVCRDDGRITMRTTVDPTLLQETLYRRLNMNPRPVKRVVIKEGAFKNATM